MLSAFGERASRPWWRRLVQSAIEPPGAHAPAALHTLRDESATYRRRRSPQDDRAPQDHVHLQPPDQRCAMCSHRPPCPPADHRDRDAAHTVAFHPEQGWSLLCNGVIVFDDLGEILPGGQVIPPHGPAHVQLAAAA
jgi:Family of unknown function (DUF5999)